MAWTRPSPSERGGPRRLPLAALVSLTLAAFTAVAVAEAGDQAGRTRPGGGGGSSSPSRASGQASYGYGGGYQGGSYWYGGYPYGYPYGSPYGYGWAAWPWGGWYGGWRYYVVAPSGESQLPGAVETDVDPKKASVLVDGEFVGQARDYNGHWDLLWLEPAPYTFEFARDGYMTLRRQLVVRPGMHVRVNEQLHQGEGLDPRSDDPPEPTASPGPAEPAARDETGRSPGALERALLHLEVQPVDAAVYLDGEFLAHGTELDRLHGALPLARGNHTLEVVRPGYKSRALEIVLDGDEPERVKVVLERSK